MLYDFENELLVAFLLEMTKHSPVSHSFTRNYKLTKFHAFGGNNKISSEQLCNVRNTKFNFLGQRLSLICHSNSLNQQVNIVPGLLNRIPLISLQSMETDKSFTFKSGDTAVAMLEYYSIPSIQLQTTDSIKHMIQSILPMCW